MKKKQSIIALIIMLALTALLGYTVIFGWGENHTGSARHIHTGLDLAGGVSITYEATESNPSSEDMADTVFKLQQRVDQYSTEAHAYRQGLNRIAVEIPGVSDANTILEELGKPGSLEFQDEDGNVVLEGTDVAGAEGVATQNQTTGEHQYIVELTLTSEGSTKFADATGENVGKRIAIVYDGEVISNPTVQQKITGGKAQITGMSTIEEAKNLASNIRIGSLSLELREIYSNVVGAQLGQDALSTSVKAGIIGIAIVILLMIVLFRISGLAAGWALILFTLLDVAMINAFEITLTLPGIAGVILTIGMAVDANVIIFTRTKEEIGAGTSIRGAIRAGYSKAFSAILDGNVTTLIAAAVLAILGTGTIKGFAYTLAMGVIISMFSALVLSRLFVNIFYGLGAKDEKYFGRIGARTAKNIVGKRVIAFTLSIILIALGPIGMAVNNARSGRAVNYSLDFIGGTATTVDFGEDVSLSDLDAKVQPVVQDVTGDANIQFQKVTSSNQVIIKTRELSVDEREQLNTALADNFEKVNADTITAENISSIISGEMRTNAVRAVIIAIILMLLYIWIRFRDPRFATAAVIALAHDILIVFMFYVVSRFSVGSTFIAVMLTILGYSINATIVVFDRIRESMNARGVSLANTVNQAVTDTMTRSIYTSLTTLITLVVLYIMGVPSVKEFSLPIIIGIIAGTYSSVLIASPVWYTFKTKIGKNRVIDVPASAPAARAAQTPEPNEAVQKAASDTANHVSAGEGKKQKKDRSELQSIKPKRGRNRR
ncbi:MAG: protein translocase subunit SecD [Eubacterium sp.]|nr:protein translocase subunit SecD [Eubacterium sp.]